MWVFCSFIFCLDKTEELKSNKPIMSHSDKFYFCPLKHYSSVHQAVTKQDPDCHWKVRFINTRIWFVFFLNNSPRWMNCWIKCLLGQNQVPKSFLFQQFSLNSSLFSFYLGITITYQKYCDNWMMKKHTDISRQNLWKVNWCHTTVTV